MVKTLRLFEAALADLAESKRWRVFILAFGVILLATANLPWHLDDYDQAKQAYVSYEIIHTGNWWFQHTPKGATASKPPFLGWVSAALYHLTGSWEVAWRLPCFLAALAILWILLKEGDRIRPGVGGLLAVSAFVLTFLTPRLATLVRTDMPLSLTIFAAGLLIYRQIRKGGPWSRNARLGFAGILTVSLFIKGPLIYGFLLPGLLAYWWTQRKKASPGGFWPGWWPFIVPLLIFLLWIIAGVLVSDRFYSDVVEREFLSRFVSAGKKGEKLQPFWFYLPHLFHKFLPWSLALLALPYLLKTVRSKLREDSSAWWLVCWTLGGIVFMTLLPSKRVDRIYPVLLPAALLVPIVFQMAWDRLRVRAFAGLCMVAATLMWGGYYLFVIPEGFFRDDQNLQRVGSRFHELVREKGWSDYGIVSSKDEGMIIYGRGLYFTDPWKAAEDLCNGSVDALLVPERHVPHILSKCPQGVVLQEFKTPGKNEKGYAVLSR